MEIPNYHILKFPESREIKLHFIEETNGVYKYEASFYDPFCLKEGESMRLIFRLEQFDLTEKQKLPQQEK